MTRSSERPRARGWRAICVLGALIGALSGLPVPVQLLAAGEPGVAEFTPLGTVKKIRQVAARFSEAMVPLGDPRESAMPFEIDCAERGTGHWVDGRSWVYDFDRDLPAGTRCVFRLRADLRTLAGAALGGPREFAFSTGGPSVLRTAPWVGSDSIDEEQAFILLLDAEPTETSVLEHVSFSVEGIAERVGVRILTGRLRDQIVGTRYPGTPPGPVLVVQARQRFPDGARVQLVWGRGVATRTAAATEQDQMLEYAVRGPFTVTMRCERENATAGCIPITPIRVRFSAPVPWANARGLSLADGTGKRYPLELEQHGSTASEVVFRGPFPEASTLTLTLPPGLKDDSGRLPVNASQFPLPVKTEPYPSLAKFAARFGIVEAKAEAVLPVTVRNLEPEITTRLLRVEGGGPGAVSATVSSVSADRPEEILRWLRRVGAARRERSVFAPGPGGPAVDPATLERFQLPKPNGEAAFEVVGLPLGGPGLYVVELESLQLGTRLLGEPRPMYVPAAALVTNLAVHLKLGREASLVWVTTLDRAEPVLGARVSILACTGATLWTGQTDEHGLARITGLPGGNPPVCSENDGGDGPYDALTPLRSGLFAIARTAGDLGFAHSGWTQGIEPWRFHLPEEFDQDPVAAHTILDRSLLRAGETVHMKHVLRRQTLRGFAPVPEQDRPTRLVIRHAGSDQVYELPLEWDAAGLAESEWPIPKTAKLGPYEIRLERPRPEGEEHRFPASWPSGEFRVEEFRVPLMRAVLKPPAEPLAGATEFPVDVAVQYLAGGGAARLPVTLRTQIRSRALPDFAGFEGFTFGNGFVTPGTTRDEDREDEDAAPAGPRPDIHQRQSLVLDQAGTARSVVTRLPSTTMPMEVLAELEFRDPSGEIQTASTRVPLWPAELLVGIEPETTWGSSSRNLKVRIAVVDLRGTPVVSAPVRLSAFSRTYYSHRKRLVGGVYAYEHAVDTSEIGELCRGTTDRWGIYVCEAPAPAAGQLVLQAAVTDGAGRTAGAHQEVSVAGADFWFDVRDSDRMDVLPERRRWEPGETARFQVQMPFRRATALVTVEREGVLDARVVRLSADDPTVEVPVKDGYAPNAFVSVLAVRGRAGDVQPAALVDLGRPAFRLGITEIRVGWRAHELKVAVTADRETYRVRERATVRVAVKTAGGGPPPAGAEVAIAAVDEGLLELQPNRSWDLLEAMMKRRGYGVSTATAQGQVVGKRHFGLKALPAGGGGGRAVTRELFETLLLWKGRVRLDARGEATIAVQLNDSLTAFRVVAVATAGPALFGTGATTIRTTQDLMILAGIAPLARESDQVRSEVTLRNTTGSEMRLRVVAKVEGLPGQLPAQTIALGAGEATAVGWDVTVPAGARALRYEVEVQEQPSGRVADRIRVTQEVRPAVPVRTVQAALFQLEQPVRQAVKRPAGAAPGRGGIQVVVRPSLAGGLTGVREWMARYPYTCLEQQVSRAVALRDERAWRGAASTLPAHQDSDGLLKYFPTMVTGDPVLTAYVLAIAHEAGWTIPSEVLERARSGLRRFVEGAIVRGSAVPAADLPIRKLAALEALTRYGRVEPPLLTSLAIEPNLWPTSAVLDWWAVLDRVPDVPGRAERLNEAEQILRSRLTLRGTTMGFSTEQSDRLWWLMVSSDANAARLILHLLRGQRWTDDLPRLMSGALARQQRGAWDLTTANAWGTLAVERFSSAFDRTPPKGGTELSLAATPRRIDWALMPKGGTLSFPWPAEAAQLAIGHSGAGRPWVSVESQAAIPLTAPLASGYRITRSVTPVQERFPGRVTRGDIHRVRLAIEAQADMTWVVVSDPIPAGASHLGTGLGRESGIAVAGERPDQTVWPAFEERTFDAYRAYYAYVPKGRFVIEYTFRLNQSGTFTLPPTRVEALYSPETFGEIPNDRVTVQP